LAARLLKCLHSSTDANPTIGPELWVERHATVLIGIHGRKKVQRWRLEWLYRLAQERSRTRRKSSINATKLLAKDRVQQQRKTLH